MGTMSIRSKVLEGLVVVAGLAAVAGGATGCSYAASDAVDETVAHTETALTLPVVTLCAEEGCLDLRGERALGVAVGVTTTADVDLTSAETQFVYDAAYGELKSVADPSRCLDSRGLRRDRVVLALCHPTIVRWDLEVDHGVTRLRNRGSEHCMTIRGPESGASMWECGYSVDERLVVRYAPGRLVESPAP